MITPAGAVKVMDFGIARAVADTSSTVTQTANVIGTAQYLSPEQARGEQVDARSDVYSTGCLLYELVTGVPPFQGDSPVAVAYQHVRENPVMPSARNPDVPRMLDSIVMKALAKNQLNRYQSAGDMRADLQRALANQPVQAEMVMTDAERTQFIARTPAPVVGVRRDVEPVEDRSSRRTGLVWAAVVIALLLVIGAAAYAIAFLGGDNNKTKQTAIPDVIGQKPTTATRLFAAHHLRLTSGNPTSGPCANGVGGKEGAICTLTPAVNTMVDENSVVQYHLYTPKTATVPNVEGLQLNEAEDHLHAAGLGWTIHAVNNTKAANTVLRQDPAGFSTKPVGTKVTLDVSTGKIKLPDVRNKTYPDARQNLNQADFSNVVRGDPITTTDPTKDDRVVRESPSPGHSYNPDQKITLDYYRYVPPKPTCTSQAATSSSTSSGSSSSSASSSGSSSSSSSASSSRSSSSSSPSVSSGAGGLPVCSKSP
jgi:serine/threonine-protein kinase